MQRISTSSGIFTRRAQDADLPPISVGGMANIHAPLPFIFAIASVGLVALGMAMLPVIRTQPRVPMASAQSAKPVALPITTGPANRLALRRYRPATPKL